MIYDKGFVAEMHLSGLTPQAMGDQLILLQTLKQPQETQLTTIDEGILNAYRATSKTLKISHEL